MSVFPSVSGAPVAGVSTVPADFVGLSLEEAALFSPALATGPDAEFIALLRSLGTGVLRIGGASADRDVFWAAHGSQSPHPAWARYVFTPATLIRLRHLLDASGWSVILDLNLAHFAPRAAAEQARAAQHILGPALRSVEIGNEPNAYARRGIRPRRWGPLDYGREIAAYRTAIRQQAPGVAISGPGSYPHAFLQAWTRALRGGPGELTQHLYPLSACTSHHPTISTLLSPATRERVQAQLRSGLRIAHAAGVRLRIGESNNVACSGTAGVSDVFASALWMEDYLAQAASAGVGGINIHMDLGVCPGRHKLRGSPYYSPICATRSPGSYALRPQWLSLRMFGALVGTHFVPITLTGRLLRSAHVYATVAPNGVIRVLVIRPGQPGSSPVTLTIATPTPASAVSATSLSGASLSSRSDIRLDTRPLVASSTTTQTVTAPAIGATLITLTP